MKENSQEIKKITNKKKNNLMDNTMAPIAQLEKSPSNSSSTMTSISSMINSNPNSAVPLGTFPTTTTQANHVNKVSQQAIKQDQMTMSQVSSNIKSTNQLQSSSSASLIENPDFVTTSDNRRCFISVWSTW